MFASEASPKMSPPHIRVALLDFRIFVLRNVFVGLSGDPVPWDRWLEVLSYEVIYSEEDFEWILAGLLPCPRSMFELQYHTSGVLQVVFTPRRLSILILQKHKRDVLQGFPIHLGGICALCYSFLSWGPDNVCKYRRGLDLTDLEDLQLPEDAQRYLVRRVGDRHNTPICRICKESRVYMHIHLKEHCAVELNSHEQVWLDWILRFYAAADQGILERAY